MGVNWLSHSIMAAFIPVVFIVGCSKANADEIKTLALYNYDRAVCKKYVPQSDIDNAIIDASIRLKVPAEYIINEAVRLSSVLNEYLAKELAIGAWCAERMKK